MDKKQEILEAAFELFCEKGYHLSMSELAGAVKIKTPSLYSHYNSKDQILEIMIRQEIERFYLFLEEKLKKLDRMSCEQAMRSIFDFSMEYFSEYKRLRFWKIIPLIADEQLRLNCRDLIAEKDNRFNKEMRLCFMKGKERSEIRNDATYSSLELFFCTVQGVLDSMLLHKNIKDEGSFSEDVFDAYWEGIRAK